MKERVNQVLIAARGPILAATLTVTLRGSDYTPLSGCFPQSLSSGSMPAGAAEVVGEAVAGEAAAARSAVVVAAAAAKRY